MSEAIWLRDGGSSTAGPHTRAGQNARYAAWERDRERQDQRDSRGRLDRMEDALGALSYDGTRGKRTPDVPMWADSRGPDGKPLWPKGTLTRREWLNQLSEGAA